MGLAPRLTAASRVIASEASTRAISSTARQNMRKSAPPPPNSSGNGIPKSPRSPIARTTSSGKWCSSSQRAACGAISDSAKARTTLRNASCSSESAKSTANLLQVESKRRGYPTWSGSAGAGDWLEDHDGGLRGSQRCVAVEVLVDLLPPRPESLAFVAPGGPTPNGVSAAAHRDSRLGMGLEIEPPRRLARRPAAPRHGHPERAVIEVAQDDAALLPGTTADGGEPKGTPAAGLGVPQADPAPGDAIHPAMAVPEESDEPTRGDPYSFSGHHRRWYPPTPGVNSCLSRR